MADPPGHPVDTVVPPDRVRDLKGLPEPMEGRSSGAPVTTRCERTKPGFRATFPAAAAVIAAR